jgi:hypothetical protein
MEKAAKQSLLSVNQLLHLTEKCAYPPYIDKARCSFALLWLRQGMATVRAVVHPRRVRPVVAIGAIHFHLLLGAVFRRRCIRDVGIVER